MTKTFATLNACLMLTIVLVTTPTRAMTPDTVPVGNIGNADDTTGFGAVDYHYRIGTTEVTNTQFADFLNAVAETDTHSLFNSSMRITQTGNSGSFSYTANSGFEQHPIAYVSFWDAARYANWLHNGQPTGTQELGTTEDGAYFLNGITTPENDTISRSAGARWFIPSEDEWYKSAYHQNDGNTGSYFVFPTSSDTAPTAEVPPGGTNSGNYDHPGLNNTTTVGAYLNTTSPYGTFDQGGNVAEWNESLNNFSSRGLRGGSFLGNSFVMSSSFRDPNVNPNGGSYIGFRVATTIPEPSSLLLGILSSAGLHIWRRRQ